MASTSETGFGPKIRRAQDLLVFLNGYPVYNPPRSEESLAEMTLLINDISSLNDIESLQMNDYRLAVDNRQNAFRNDPGSIRKLLSPLANAVVAQFGKSAKQTILIMEIVNKIRSTKVTKPKAPEGGAKPPVSKSEQSYGSLAKAFADLVTAVSQLPGFNPSNTALTIPALQQKVTELAQLSDDVAQRTQVLGVTKSKRADKYEILHDRVQRIKAYIKAHYGIASQEYKSIRALRI